ncbi:MAG: hypothetical protein K1Y36_19615 [Blastocatellia bacterium]|nr:hypothetical protein [Blastocatellia bacterium]
MFEHRDQPPLSLPAFRLRLVKFFLVASTLVAVALGLGMLGYHSFESLNWIDSFLNASMILGGMGPVTEVKTTGGKIFAGTYALFSGLVFLVAAGLVVGPLVHRLLHTFHFDPDTVESDQS